MNLAVLKRKKFVLAASLIAAVCCISLALATLFININNKNDTDKAPATKQANIKPPLATTAQGATGFVQQVYGARLQVWNSDERGFIAANKDWFSQEFLDSLNSPEAKEPFLFCKKVINKPEKFEVSSGGLFKDQGIANVYINGFYQNKLEVANLSLQLRNVNGLWKIHSPKCDLI